MDANFPDTVSSQAHATNFKKEMNSGSAENIGLWDCLTFAFVRSCETTRDYTFLTRNIVRSEM